MTKMPACFRLPFQIHPDIQNWRILHRPLFPGTRPEETACHPAARELDLDRESIWISYCSMALEGQGRIGWASLPRIIGWRLRCHPGSGSRSAAALRPS